MGTSRSPAVRRRPRTRSMASELSAQNDEPDVPSGPGNGKKEDSSTSDEEKKVVAVKKTLPKKTPPKKRITPKRQKASLGKEEKKHSSSSSDNEVEDKGKSTTQKTVSSSSSEEEAENFTRSKTKKKSAITSIQKESSSSDSSDDELSKKKPITKDASDTRISSVISRIEEAQKTKKKKMKFGLASFANSDTSDDEEEEEETVDHIIDNDDKDSEIGEEEMALEAAVFGAFARKSERKEESIQPTSLFVVDKGDDDDESDGNSEKNDKVRSAVWDDEDDANVEVDISDINRLRKLRKTESDAKISGVEYTKRLREQREKLNPGSTSWAKPPQKRNRIDNDSDDDEMETNLLQSSEGFTQRRSMMRKLPPGRISVSRLHDLNQHSPGNAVIQSVDWHKREQLCLLAGFDKTAKIFKVDGKVNAKVESIYLPDMPIYSAKFCGAGHDHVLCVGRRPFFYWFDLESGSVSKIPGILGRKERSLESVSVSPDGSLLAFLGYDGNVILVSQKTKQWVGNLKMNENGTCCSFTSDSRYLYTGGDHGNVYCWDIKTMSIKNRFQDEGSINVSSLAISPTHKHIAVGSQNGVVNIYDVKKSSVTRKPTPEKTSMNLTTRIDSLTYNHDGQILAMLSRRKKDALRLLNMNTLNIIPNWPTSKTPIHYGSAVGFNPSSSMLAIGNDKGRCLLYKMQHFV